MDLYKDSIVLALQANAKLVQKGECSAWKPRPVVQFSQKVIFYHLFFCFHAVKPQMPILALLPIFV